MLYFEVCMYVCNVDYLHARYLTWQVCCTYTVKLRGGGTFENKKSWNHANNYVVKL